MKLTWTRTGDARWESDSPFGFRIAKHDPCADFSSLRLGPGLGAPHLGNVDVNVMVLMRRAQALEDVLDPPVCPSLAEFGSAHRYPTSSRDGGVSYQVYDSECCPRCGVHLDA